MATITVKKFPDELYDRFEAVRRGEPPQHQ